MIFSVLRSLACCLIFLKKSGIMIRNYLKAALRSLSRNKVHSLIIILGLAVGLAAVFIIAIFLKHEYSFDRFFKDSEKIYRVVTVLERDGSRSPHTFEDVAAATKETVPGIKAATRFYAYDHLEVRRNSELMGDYKVLYGDSSFFNVFSLGLLQGNPATELDKKGCVVLTRSMKERVFANEPALNQVVQMDEQDYTVVGVMEDVPSNCHIQFDMLLSFSSLSESFRRSNAVDYPTYFRFDDVPARDTKDQVNAFVAGWVNKKFEGYDVTVQSRLQPMEDIHMGEVIQRDYAVTGDRSQMVIFSVVAIIILVIAVFNFVNLFTAQSESRLKEVGIRKVIGSRRRQLIRQFLGESALVGVAAFVVAMVLVETFLPHFFDLLRVDFEWSYRSAWGMIAVFFLFTIMVGMASAWYPALYVSSFNPVRIFHGSFPGTSPGKPLRTGLVILQFTLSVGLITSIITLYSQVQYMKNKDVGIDREHTAYFYNLSSSIKRQYESIRGELLSNPRIKAVTASMSIPAGSRSPMSMRRPEQDPAAAFNCKENRVQPGYLDTYGIELLRGKDFTSPHDSEDILINETAARKLGYDDPLGKEVVLWQRRCRIIGVVKDYHFRSLHRPIEPLALSHYYDLKQNISVRAAGGFDNNTLDYIEGVFHRHDPGYTFRYNFVDDVFASLYGREDRLNTLILVAAFLGIVLSVIGLYAFVSLILSKRMKEMGIRKAFGASTGRLLGSMASALLVWIAISAALGWSLAYFFTSDWLANFPFRIELRWWMFVASGLTVTVLAAMAVTGKILSLARVRPAHILRYE